MRTIFIAAIAAAGLFGPVGSGAVAQTAWPQKPVRLILPTVPGGGIDTLSRTLQNAVSEKLGKPVLIENRPSNAYIVSTEMVVRATDDHTIGMILVNTHAANATVQPSLPYDTLKDITPIINLNISPNIIAVHPSYPAKTLAELVADAKANPGKLFYATSGIGGGQHFAGEMLKQTAGIDMIHVPYKGSGASLKDAVSGQIKIIFGNVISASPYIQAGSLRALAVTTAKRSPLFPDVPTTAEAGYAKVRADGFAGLFVLRQHVPVVAHPQHRRASRPVQAKIILASSAVPHQQCALGPLFQRRPRRHLIRPRAPVIRDPDDCHTR